MASGNRNGDYPGHRENESITQAASQPAEPHPEEVEESRPEENVNSLRVEQVTTDGSVPDDSDARWIGLGRPIAGRPRAVMSVERDAPEYKMDHKKRGWAIILVHDYFETNLQPRKSAEHDRHIIKNALKHLSFHVEECWNLGNDDFERKLKEVSSRDHKDNDCLVIVFMSHGDIDQRQNREYLCTRDGKVDTTKLWKNFTADKCPSLAGKPKLFFIQACRGDNTDRGIRMERPIGLRVQTDSAQIPDNYVIPLHADMLIMWASYPGMYAFKSQNNGINGSVFIHFLAKVLSEDGRSDDLSTLLLRVTREVATLYESFSPDKNYLHQNKQTPYTVSTLMRKLYFPVRT